MSAGTVILARRCIFIYSAPQPEETRGRPRRCKASVMLGSSYCWRHGDAEYIRAVRSMVTRETEPLWQRALESRA